MMRRSPAARAASAKVEAARRSSFSNALAVSIELDEVVLEALQQAAANIACGPGEEDGLGRHITPRSVVARGGSSGAAASGAPWLWFDVSGHRCPRGDPDV